MEAVEPLLEWLSAHPGWLGTAIFTIALIESLAIAGVVVPGVALLFAVAVLAGETGLGLLPTLAFAWSGAVVGDGVSFWLGRLFSGRLHEVWPFRRYPSVIENGERFFRRHGGKSIVIGRFVGPIRPVLPLVAGAFAMPARLFLVFNLTSAVGWAPVYILPGFLVGSAMAQSIDLPPHFYPIMGIALGILALIYALFFRLHYDLLNRGRLYEWLARRVNRSPAGRVIWRHFSSRRQSDSEFPLPSLVLSVVTLTGFILWTLIVVETRMLGDFDQATASFFQTLRHPLIDPVMVGLTRLADVRLLTILFMIAAAALAFRRRSMAAVHIVIAGTATAALVSLLKVSLGVPRPELVLVPPESGAYPSGHAAGIALVLGLSASFLAREYHGRHRWMIYAGFSLPMLAVSLSRVYLGVHWFSDVVGGLMLGLMVSGVTRFSYSRHDQSPMRPGSFTLATLALMAGVALAYVATDFTEAAQAFSPVTATEAR
ncbi:undecaprenyl-diphosphatase [Tamilnaduibacter salinus]|uniref:Undecaprenyl-diphosphatase n=1 Tax=Tamilnaduibacter salinus TaxID=1484056 RepID=A0A2U1D0E4_9GAMM|nr:bifunctional DedA family/phosphatase PAP2 family protein [Tamilnaduibacter salinus]PVY78855.1 undecaprenyl-diphosphatase [Tamilnaduibacter salinus]